MSGLDQIEQRILGVLIEKEQSVPDSYPMTENSLRLGCNQSNNRDPVLSLRDEDLGVALRSLMEKGWARRIDGAGRSTKWRHIAVERLGVTAAESFALCELLLRGPQAPGALRPRIQRLGFQGEVGDVEALLQRLASRPQPLVEQMPLAPRERDRRWRHLLGDASQGQGQAPASAAAAAALAGAQAEPSSSQTAPPAAAAPMVDPMVATLEARVAELERQMRELRRELGLGPADRRDG